MDIVKCPELIDKPIKYVMKARLNDNDMKRITIRKLNEILKKTDSHLEGNGDGTISIVKN
jgi:hypothetical protein